MVDWLLKNADLVISILTLIAVANACFVLVLSHRVKASRQKHELKIESKGGVSDLSEDIEDPTGRHVVLSDRDLDREDH